MVMIMIMTVIMVMMMMMMMMMMMKYIILITIVNTLKSFRGQIKLEPRPDWSPRKVQYTYSRMHFRMNF